MPVAPSSEKEAPMELTINHLKEPLGYQLGVPVLTLSGADVPTAYTVEVTGADQAMAGHVWQFAAGGLSGLGVPAQAADAPSEAAPRHTVLPIPLLPRTKYLCRVKCPASGGTLAETTFETGKMGEPWQGKWITAPKGDRLPRFCKRIPVEDAHGQVVRARLYICGLGVYEATINGVRVGTEYMTPYCNNYHAWQQVITHDVTEQLQQSGDLAILLGEGWWAGRFGFTSKVGDKGYYGDDLRLIAEVWLTYADGTTARIPTDDTWIVQRSRLTFSGIYDGEHRDDTLPDVPSAPATVLEEDTRLLQDRLSPPVHVQETWHPEALITTPKGELVLDAGQNHAGTFQLRVHQPRGTRIHLQFGEVLQDGCFYRENLRSALAEYIYTSDGAPRVLMPHFTFYGYRYVKVTGIPNLAPTDYTCMALYTDLPETGEITTGHDKVNQLLKNIRWGLKGNALDVPTDCPQRDERMGWTGDANVFSPTACFLQDMMAFYAKYLKDMGTEQETREGRVPHVVPAFGLGEAFGSQASCCVWGDACTRIPWAVYQASGDVAVLKNHYPHMKAWVDCITRFDGADHAWRRTFHFGDWVALDHPSHKEDQVLGGTEEGYIADVSYMESAEILAETARILGNGGDAAHYDALAKRIRRDILAEYFTSTGRCAIATQTGLLLALKHHLGEEGHRAKLIGQLERLLNQTEGQLTTGFVGTPILLPTLCQVGMDHLAYDMLLREGYPGWLYQVNLGATTVWERWNSMNPDGTVSSTGMNSFNHYAYGSVGHWIAAYAGGLTPKTPGYGQATIAPVMDSRLSPFRLRYRSPYGIYEVDWAEAEAGITLQITVPRGCTAHVHLPDHYYDRAGSRVALTPGRVIQAGGTETYRLAPL